MIVPQNVWRHVRHIKLTYEFRDTPVKHPTFRKKALP